MRTFFFEPRDPFDEAAHAGEAEYRHSLLLVPSSVRLLSSWLQGSDTIAAAEGAAEAPALLASRLLLSVLESDAKLDARKQVVEQEEVTCRQLLNDPTKLSLQRLAPR